MSLADYAKDRDHFQHRSHDAHAAGLAFPCDCCEHRDGRDTDEPCCQCDHNVNAQPPTPACFSSCHILHTCDHNVNDQPPTPEDGE